MEGRSHGLPMPMASMDDCLDGSCTVGCPCSITFDDGREMVKSGGCGVWVYTCCTCFICRSQASLLLPSWWRGELDGLHWRQPVAAVAGRIERISVLHQRRIRDSRSAVRSYKFSKCSVGFFLAFLWMEVHDNTNPG